MFSAIPAHKMTSNSPSYHQLLNTSEHNLSVIPSRPPFVIQVTDSIPVVVNETWSKNDKREVMSGGDIAFILIPLLLIISLAFISGFALVCMQRRKKFDRLRHRLIPVYNFTTEDDDEWGVLIDNDNNAMSNR
ncbi:unnamed protein product [Allacma fusca]|uniref:Uncharacterized protein n=1 Tax=Allacma fusca TaxID=39272 RepID=A0A8J2Q6W0_9HEXA|nr:unnamed protein product [Allacma fusca]